MGEQWGMPSLMAGFTLNQAARLGGLPLVRAILLRMMLDLAAIEAGLPEQELVP